ncbi:MAG: hypothetical protein Q9M92_14160 [Enterobacterales bacterium]|nr:hypothetical protein [Enterobacterales bacterium]
MSSYSKFVLFIIYCFIGLILFACNDSTPTTLISQSNLPSDNQATQAPHLEIKSYDWQGEIPASKLVIIENPYGSIRSRNHSDRMVYLHATFQLIGDHALTPSFETEENEQFVKISVKYPESIHDQQGQLRGRTDVSVLFPDDVSILAKTDKGLIKIDKSASHVEASSHSGDIQIDTRGLLKIATESGNIKLKLRGQKLRGLSKISSDSGTIKAEIFNDMSISLKAETQGEISLNGQVVSKLPPLILGDGESDISLVSHSGNITILTVKPPELVHSVKPVNATSVDIDLRQIKKSTPWKPGDPIYNRDDKKNH